MYSCRFLLHFLIIITAGALYSQQATDSPPFKSSVEVVLIPTLVTDKSGAQVMGMKKEQFVLNEDGKARPIAIFEEISTDTERLHRTAGENGQFTNFNPVGEAHHRLSIIVLDLINTSLNNQFVGRAALMKFLSQVADSGEPICLITLTRSGITLIHDFTEDPKNLAEAVRKLPSNNAPLGYENQVNETPPSAAVATSAVGGDFVSAELVKLARMMIEAEKQLAAQQRKNSAITTIDGLIQIAKAFGGLPGRKSLIWASAGFPYSISSPSMSLCEPACPASQRDDIQPLYDKLWRTMNDNQISIYSVDLRSLAANNFDSSNDSGTFTHPWQIGDRDFDRRAETKWEFEDSTSTLRLFAENTGGKAFINSNDLVQGFRQAANDSSHYYVLGYYVDRSKTKPGWHKLSVTVRDKGVHARFRNGFFLKGGSTDIPSTDIRLGLASPLDFTGIALAVNWSGVAPGKDAGKKSIQFDLVMPSRFAWVDESDQNHLRVEIAAVALNEKGGLVGEVSQRIDRHLPPDGLQQIMEHGMTYRSALQLPPGDYTVRFVVLDSLGNRMGSVAAPVKVEP